MAVPTSKSTFKEYCLRALGKGVIDINVSDDQIDWDLKRRKARGDLGNQADSIVYQTKNTLDDAGDKLEEKETEDRKKSDRTPQHSIRGEMPGFANDATIINDKGPF